MMNSSSTTPWNFAMLRKFAVWILALALTFIILYCSSCNNHGQFLPSLDRFSFNRFNFSSSTKPVHDEYYELRNLLEAASTTEKTVILTYLNEAWAAPGSIFDIFLESFKIGNNTAYLLNHMLVIAVDDDAYSRCQTLVSYCYLLKSNASSELAHQANFMTPVYLDMVWRRLAFLKTILTLGYNFVITDTDVVWFRDPFPHFIPESDVQTSCDRFNGRQFDLDNAPNVGFLFARSNNRTIKFYEYWVSLRHKYPNFHEQDAFNQIKHEPSFTELGVKVRFLDTNYFSGFCSPSRDINKVCTMHANCCVGLNRKIEDLKTALENWKTYYSTNHTVISTNHTPISPNTALSANNTAVAQPFHWSVPSKCHM